MRLDPAPHPFEIEHAAAIEANWKLEHAANPAFFDGRMVMLSELIYLDGRITGRCHEVRFATMLFWRKNRHHLGVEHCFAVAALVASDNAMVAIRMGAHTANPGRVYFAAGSFERQDFMGERADPYSNMRREVLEETGLDLDAFERDPVWHIYSKDNATALFRRFKMPDPADAVAGRIATHVAADPHPEIVGPVVIRNGTDLPEGLMPHMSAIIDWHFSSA